MAVRKPTEGDSDYIRRKLSIIKDQMDKAERYLSSNPWDLMEDQDKKEREFRFQKSLSDSLVSWSESYMKMCGIMDVYDQIEAAKSKKTLKGGQVVSGIQSFVKKEASVKLGGAGSPSPEGFPPPSPAYQNAICTTGRCPCPRGS